MPATTPQLATKPQPSSPPVTRDFRQEVTNGIVHLLEIPWQNLGIQAPPHSGCP